MLWRTQLVMVCCLLFKGNTWFASPQVSSLLGRLPVLVIDAVSCAARGDRIVKRLGRISGTETADGPCASYNASWARPNVRISSHIPPSHSDTAFLLNTQTHATVSNSPWGPNENNQAHFGHIRESR